MASAAARSAVDRHAESIEQFTTLWLTALATGVGADELAGEFGVDPTIEDMDSVKAAHLFAGGQVAALLIWFGRLVEHDPQELWAMFRVGAESNRTHGED